MPLNSIIDWQDGEPIQKSVKRDAVSSVEVIEIEDEFEASDQVTLLGLLIGQFRFDRPPHIRHQIIKTGDDQHIWNLCVHHAFADALTLQHLGRAFSRAYLGQEIEVVGFPLEYLINQREWLRSAQGQAQLNEWLRILGQHPNGSSPTDSQTIPNNNKTFQQGWCLCGRTMSNLRELAEILEIPLVALFASIFASANKSSSQQSVTMLMNLPGRSLPGSASAIGCFYNTLPLTLSTEFESFDELAIAASKTLLSLFARQELPVSLLDLALQRRGCARISSRFHTSLNVVEHPLSKFVLPGLQMYHSSPTTMNGIRLGHCPEFEVLGNPAPEDGGMSWNVCPFRNGLHISVEYSSPKFHHSFARRQLENFVSEVCRHAEVPRQDSGEISDEGLLIEDWTESNSHQGVAGGHSVGQTSGSP